MVFTLKLGKKAGTVNGENTEYSPFLYFHLYANLTKDNSYIGSFSTALIKKLCEPFIACALIVDIVNVISLSVIFSTTPCISMFSSSVVKTISCPTSHTGIWATVIVTLSPAELLLKSIDLEIETAPPPAPKFVSTTFIYGAVKGCCTATVISSSWIGR